MANGYHAKAAFFSTVNQPNQIKKDHTKIIYLMGGGVINETSFGQDERVFSFFVSSYGGEGSRRAARMSRLSAAGMTSFLLDFKSGRRDLA